MDYYICSQEFTEHDMKLHVAEKFESKHLPVELLLFPKEYQSPSKDRSVLERLVWDSEKKSLLSNQLGVSCFKIL